MTIWQINEQGEQTTPLQTATEQAWTNFYRVCRIGGQGLNEGQAYKITDLWYEIFGRDMMVSHATVTDVNGNHIEIKNAHIAFDIDDILEA